MATKIAFPTGRRISSLFTKYNPTRPDQAKLDRTAIGHHPDYQTHELSLKDANACIATRTESVCKWEDFRSGETHAWDLNRTVLKRKDRVMEKHQQMNPYYNVVVDDAIISGHGGIWEPEYFMEFIARFVTVQNAKRCEDYRAAGAMAESSSADHCHQDSN